MRVVADKLAEWAVSERNEKNADAFGRSAFNRYYYASYLVTRQMLHELNTKWTRTNHRDIPKLLNRSVINRIRTDLRRQQRVGLISSGDAAKYQNYATSAVSELSNILQQAYNVRVTADYEPEEKIVRNRRQIRLRDHTLHSAHNWTKRVKRYTGTILNVWRQLGLS